MKQNKVAPKHISQSNLNQDSIIEQLFYKKLAEALKDPSVDRLFAEMPSDDSWADYITTTKYNCNIH